MRGKSVLLLLLLVAGACASDASFNVRDSNGWPVQTWRQANGRMVEVACPIKQVVRVNALQVPIRDAWGRQIPQLTPSGINRLQANDCFEYEYAVNAGASGKARSPGKTVVVKRIWIENSDVADQPTVATTQPSRGLSFQQQTPSYSPRSETSTRATTTNAGVRAR